VENAGLIFGISAVIHGVVLAVLTLRVPALPPEEPTLDGDADVEIELVDREPAPVDVVMLSAPEIEKLVATAAPAPTTQVMPRPVARRAITATTEATTEVAIDPRLVDPREINPLFAMRGNRRDEPRPIDLRVPVLHRDAIDHVPRGTDAVVVPDSGELAPSGGGTYRSDKGAFTARVNRDGSVDLKNARNLRINVPDPRKIPKAVGKHIADWAASEDKLPGDPDKVAINNHRSGDKDTRPDHGNTAPVAGGGFDITDALMRRKKVDPYAAAKLRYLDSTRDERVQIGTRYKKQQLAQSAELMQKQLDLLARASLEQKKQALFELWDDCAETGDASLVEGGRQARALVIGYIRAHVTYTEDELAALNRKKQSKAAFAP
jgi:hypothetical protein